MMNKELIKDYLAEFIKTPLPWFIERELKVSETERRVITIIGPRRAGKTYYLYQLMSKNKENALYLNFEDTRLMEVSFKEVRDVIRMFKEICGKEPMYLFLDEVQNLHRWEMAVRELLDTRKFRIFVTGSSSKLLSREIATSLRGRTLTYTLLPFSFSEYLKAKNIPTQVLSKDDEALIKKELMEYLQFGGFPEVVLEKEKEKILKEFYDLTLFKDIIERHNLRNISLAKFLLSFFAQNFSCEISVNKILNFFKSQGKKFGRNTLYDYIDKIQDTVAIFFVNRYSEKIYTRESWPKKIYLADTGISRVVRFSTDTGRLMENAVFLELLRRTNIHPLMEIYFLRVNNKEIDFVVKEGMKMSLIQVCYEIEDLKTREREIKSLLKGSEELKCNDLQIITWDYEGEEKFNGMSIRFIPLWKWLITGDR
jgi:predicted AAA+ superfamily ATPase